jgi:hypothetical protein
MTRLFKSCQHLGSLPIWLAFLSPFRLSEALQYIPEIRSRSTFHNYFFKDRPNVGPKHEQDVEFKQLIYFAAVSLRVSHASA